MTLYTVVSSEEVVTQLTATSSWKSVPSSSSTTQLTIVTPWRAPTRRSVYRRDVVIAVNDWQWRSITSRPHTVFTGTGPVLQHWRTMQTVMTTGYWLALAEFAPTNFHAVSIVVGLMSSTTYKRQARLCSHSDEAC